MKANQSTKPNSKSQVSRHVAWYNHRLASFGLALVGLLVTYLIASRAIDTGSLQQYFLTIVALIFAINRLINTVQGGRHGGRGDSSS